MYPVKRKYPIKNAPGGTTGSPPVYPVKKVSQTAACPSQQLNTPGNAAAWTLDSQQQQPQQQQSSTLNQPHQPSPQKQNLQQPDAKQNLLKQKHKANKYNRKHLYGSEGDTTHPSYIPGLILYLPPPWFKGEMN